MKRRMCKVGTAQIRRRYGPAELAIPGIAPTELHHALYGTHGKPLAQCGALRRYKGPEGRAEYVASFEKFYCFSG